MDKEFLDNIFDLDFINNIGNNSINKHGLKYSFKEYYDVDIIEKAINKYINNEWNKKDLAQWAYAYYIILSKGSDKELNQIEMFIKETILWDLDGMSFFDDYIEDEEDMDDIKKSISDFKNLDIMFKSSHKLRFFYAAIGHFAQKNDDQYVLLINDEDKQYIIIYSDYFKNGYNNKFIKYISKEEHLKLVNELSESGYTLLSYSESFYFEDALCDEE